MISLINGRIQSKHELKNEELLTGEKNFAFQSSAIGFLNRKNLSFAPQDAASSYDSRHFWLLLFAPPSHRRKFTSSVRLSVQPLAS